MLENGLPSPPVRVNGPPKLTFLVSAVSAGVSLDALGSRTSAAVPAKASATRTQRRIRTSLRVRRGGWASLVIGRAFAQRRRSKQRGQSKGGAPARERRLPDQSPD